MEKRIKLFYLIFSLLVWLGIKSGAYAQVISAPSLGLTQACASRAFNTYNISFSVAPVASLGPGNQFIVEMSNASGSFASPVAVATLPTTTTTVVNGSFSVPTNVYGEGYRIRVRSTVPAKTSGASAMFPAYYAMHNQPFAINNNVGTVNICSGTSYTLSIDNTGDATSPLFYPALTYKWYKDFVQVPGQTGPSLTVSQSGSYYVVTNYGSCNMNSYSNFVTVNIQNILTPVITTNDGSNLLCPSVAKVLTSDVQDSSFTYTWYRDNAVIPGANTYTYSATQGGLYHLVIAGGGCIFETNEIELESVDFNLDIDPSATTVIMPGEQIVLSALDDAVNPTYQWYRNSNTIGGATQDSYTTTQQGTYKVAVNEATPCNTTKEASVTIAYPASFNLAIQAAAGYQSCTSTSATLTVSQFQAVNGADITNLITNPYGYTYQWYKNNVAVAGATANQLVINDAANSGDYTLKVSLPDYGEVTSNALTVNLSVGNVVISGPTSICEGAIAPLTSNITNAAYTYAWYKDNNLLPAITTATLAADDAGDYYLRITNGNCTIQSNTIHIDIEDITISSANPASDVILPGQSKTLTVTTDAVGPTYVWYRNNVVISGAASASYTATQNGTYKVVVTQNVGCNADAETTFTLNYPTGFTLVTAVNAGYTPCTSTTATLNIGSFEAQTANGNVNVAGLGYAYQWYRNNAIVSGATAATLSLNNASQNGTYKLVATVPDFGTVTSNDITVNLAMGAVSVTGGTSLCASGSLTLSSSVANAGYTYQWYKDTVAVPGATAATLTVNQTGAYYVVVTSGSCSAQSPAHNVQQAAVSVTVNVPANDIILPGQTKTITVTTDAAAPTYTWYRDNVLQSATGATFNATQDGTYKVVVTQTSGCTATAETTFALNYPSSFNIAIAADAAYTACNSTIASLDITAFTATTPSGSVDVSVLGYAYQWYRNDVAVPGATAATYILGSAADNGNYKLVATVPDYGTVTSNTITVNVAVESIVISNAAALCEGATATITANVNDAGYAYQWYKNGSALTGETAATLTTGEAGDYYLTVNGGTCSAQSNTIHLQVAEISITTTNPTVDVIFPGQTKTLSVTTDAVAPTYVWYRNNGVIAGATAATYTATQDGEYKVEVTQTSGCAATDETTFTLQYPSAFSMTIAVDAAYASCASSTATLSVTGFTATTPSGTVDASALGYAYQWHKDNAPVPGATAATLVLNNPAQNGSYKVVVTIPDFAPVNSNAIAINLSLPAGSVTVSKSGSLCAASTVQLMASVNDTGYAYQWYRNGIVLAGANAPVFNASSTGDYYVVVTAGSCTTQSNTVQVQNAAITVTSVNPAVDVILPGQTKTLTVTTDAVAPAYVWYRNNGVIAGASSASYTATEDGEYKVVVTETSGCTVTAERIFLLQYPSSFALAITANAGYTPCASNPVTLSISAFTAQTPSGTVDVSALGYTYQWYKNGNSVAGATGSTLTLNNASQNGNYTVEAIIPDFAPVVSNSVNVAVGIPANSVVIAQNGTLCNGGTVQLTANINDAAFTYQWYKNGTAVAGATSADFTADSEGSYYVVVASGVCTSQSNTLNVTEAAITINTANPANDIILPGQAKTITITTDAAAPQYVWYRNNVLLAETSATLTATENGTYKVVVTQTSGCTATNEKIFILDYPTGFEITISTDASYTACTSSAVVLNVSGFIALAPTGAINVATAGYAYQWYKDGVAVPGATLATLSLNSVSQNGTYTVQATVPGFDPVVSNSIVVNLGLGTITIQQAGSLCDETSQVVFTSSITDTAYTYKWFKDNAEVASGNDPQYTATQPGSYRVEVTNGSCTAASDAISIQVSDFNLAAVTPLTDVIIPGSTKTLTVTTDAAAPQFVWYRNGIELPGQNSTSLTATLAGEYKVVVTQTEGCVLSKEILFNLTNPSGFALTIAADNYQPCVSTQVNLYVAQFKAVTEQGIVDIPNGELGYTYQWYKDGGIIAGATAEVYTATETGIYTLEINIPGFGFVTSNGIAAELAFTDKVTISMDEVFCTDGTEVTLYSDVTNPDYLYTWYHNDSALITGAGPTLTVSEMGSYYLEVTYHGCTIRSNTLVLEPYNMDQIIISVGGNVDLPEGTSITVTASGAESYIWYFNGEEIGTGDSIEITQPGNYAVKATVGECEVTREFVVTLKENNLIAIPNVITPNGDGINDTWTLPLKYITEDTEVVVYAADGTIVLRESPYNNSWPPSDFLWSQKSPVYYYTIMEDNKITKRGSITFVK